MKKEMMILRPRKGKTILLGLVSLLFVAGGALMIGDRHPMGWFVTGFFGLGFMVFMAQLVPGASQLVLTKEGFIVTSLFRSQFTKWQDVKSFEEGYMGRKKAVMFNYLNSHTNYVIGKDIARGLSGFDGALPDTYGLKVSELRNLMNAWKNKRESDV